MDNEAFDMEEEPLFPRLWGNHPLFSDPRAFHFFTSRFTYS